MTFQANDSLTEQIAQYLEKLIVFGEMKPNERIQEIRIASQLEVSRSSVREALLILQRRHLVEIYPRRGAVVASINAQDVKDFFELWLLLLDHVVSHLAQSWQEGELAPLFDLMTRLDQCRRQGDLDGFYQHGMQFIRTLYRHTDNRYLTHTLDDLFPLTQRCLYAIMRAGQSHIARTYRFLEQLLKVIVARDQTRLHHMVQDFGATYSQLAQTSVEALQGRHSE